MMQVFSTCIKVAFESYIETVVKLLVIMCLSLLKQTQICNVLLENLLPNIRIMQNLIMESSNKL